MDAKEYFSKLGEQIDRAYGIANEARKKGKDVETKVECMPSADKNNRCIDILSTLYPEFSESREPILKRISELEEKYGIGADEVALEISKEISLGKFFKLKSLEEMIAAGLRFGCAFNTKGVVGAPLEGITNVKIDPSAKFLYVYYAGPIRTAGGTAQVFTLFIADHIRRALGLNKYHATKEEMERYYTELTDYLTYVTRKQYKPSEEEVNFLVSHVPICLSGEPTEQREVSRHKDCERAETTKIRGGMCLVYLDGLPLKAEKLLKKLKKYGEEMGLTESWMWLEDFIKIKKGKKGKAAEQTSKVHKFLQEVPAGRPVYAMPDIKGGFRLRYGRSRNMGSGCFGFHPATQGVLDSFPAVASQMKIEVPGKGCTVGVCDKIEPPIVRLKNGDVVRLLTLEEAKEAYQNIDKILFVGDMLVTYGDFFENGEKLIPTPYVEEVWLYDLEENIEAAKKAVGVESVEALLKNPDEIDAQTAIKLAEAGIPLHPKYLHFYDGMGPTEIAGLIRYLSSGERRDGHFVLKNDGNKALLEAAFIPHRLSVDKMLITLEDFEPLIKTFEGMGPEDVEKDEDSGYALVNKHSKFEIKEKATKYIGARMGRPEKSMLRKMKGSPQVLFPVGDAGGRMRNLAEVENLISEISHFACPEHGASVFPYCIRCGRHLQNPTRTKKNIYVRGLLNEAYQNLQEHRLEMIKGVRGVTSKRKVPEPIEKGILRAKHGLYVFRDGTIRFDMVNAPLTHFKPKEVGTNIEKLRELGYTKDIKGAELTDSEQVLELFPQDFLLSTYGEESAAEYFLSVAKFIDDLLTKYYGLEPFYKAERFEDLVGHLFLDIAPHTIAPVTCRLIGFTSNRCHYAHPYLFAATRRDCFLAEEKIPLLSGDRIKLVEIGKYFEAMAKKNGTQKADAFGTLMTWTDDKALTLKEGMIVPGRISALSKHKSEGRFLRIKTRSNREIIATETHNFFVYDGKTEGKCKELMAGAGLKKIKAKDLKAGQNFAVPLNLDLPEKDENELDLTALLGKEGRLVIRGVSEEIKEAIPNIRQYAKSRGINYHTFFNYFVRDSFPIRVFDGVCKEFGLSRQGLLKKARLGFEKERVSVPAVMKIDETLLYLIGFYIAEGYSRAGERNYQVSFAAIEPENRKRIKEYIKSVFGIVPYEAKESLTVSGKIPYLLFSRHFALGSNARDKSLEYFMLFPKEKIKPILQGYFDGDGSTDNLRIRCASANEGLLGQIEIMLMRFGIFTTAYSEDKAPKRGKVAEFYLKRGRAVPKTRLYYLSIQSSFAKKFCKEIGFRLERKKNALQKATGALKGRDTYEVREGMVLDPITEIGEVKNRAKYTYCLTVTKTHNLFSKWVVGQCDGEENGVILMIDCLLNFSKEYIPERRGSISDAPLTISTILDLGEVDDEVYDMDIAPRYSKEFYEKTKERVFPWEVKVEQVGDRLGKSNCYEGLGYTTENSNFNRGVHLTTYKTAEDMVEKISRQLGLAEKLNCVDEMFVAEKILSSHFLKDIKGNFRTFFRQTFRCTACQNVIRRPPLNGKCPKCSGPIVLTVSEGTILKYLEASKKIAEDYKLEPYLYNQLTLLQSQINNVFGKKDRQCSLAAF
jgi:DNA polymerase II large subunit